MSWKSLRDQGKTERAARHEEQRRVAALVPDYRYTPAPRRASWRNLFGLRCPACGGEIKSNYFGCGLGTYHMKHEFCPDCDWERARRWFVPNYN